MGDRYINRYNTFCKCLINLNRCTTADPNMPFVLEGIVTIFSYTFDVAWKVLKDILIKRLEVTGFASGSPMEVLQASFSNGLIDSDVWIHMLRCRNRLAHDYDGEFAKEMFDIIVKEYTSEFNKLSNTIEHYYDSGELKQLNSFS